MAGGPQQATNALGKSFAELDHFKNADQQCLFRKEWPSNGRPRALVQIVHGFAEHIMTYDLIIEAFTKEGFLMFGHDHIGHGQSQGVRLDVDDFSIFVRDVLLHTDIMKKKYPDLPCFLLGHSMGGLVAAMAAQVRVELFDGVVLVAPALMTSYKTASRPKRFLARCLASVAPMLKMGELDSSKISRDPEVVKRYIADPLNPLKVGIRARFGIEMLQAQTSFMQNAHKFEVPFLTLHGTSDELADPQSSQILYEKARSRDKSIQLYPGWYHQVHFEPNGDGERAIRDMVNWLKDRLNAHVDI